jgi:hypothetical protein
MPTPIGRAIEEGVAVGRLIKEPLYDTETIGAADGAAYNEIVLFSRPQGQTMLDGTQKTVSHTNLTQAGMLGEPNQFLLMGFRFALLDAYDDTLTKLTAGLVTAMERNIRSRGILSFGLGGKTIIEVPLKEIPEGVGPQGFWSQAADATSDAYITRWGNGQANDYYSLRIPPRVLQLFKVSEKNIRLTGYEMIFASTPINAKLMFSPAITTEAKNWYKLQLQLVGVRLKNIA